MSPSEERSSSMFWVVACVEVCDRRLTIYDGHQGFPLENSRAHAEVDRSDDEKVGSETLCISLLVIP